MKRKDFIATLGNTCNVNEKDVNVSTWLLIAMTQLLYAIADKMAVFEEDEEDPKQKNGEYDEKYLNFILDLLEDQKKFCKKNAEGARYSKELSSAQTWLKSKFK